IGSDRHSAPPWIFFLCQGKTDGQYLPLGFLPCMWSLFACNSSFQRSTLPLSAALRHGMRLGSVPVSYAECDETGTDPNSLPGETPCGIRWVSGRHACGNN